MKICELFSLRMIIKKTKSNEHGNNDELYKDIREDKCKRHLYFFR